MAIITISRELGSGGTQIAQALAEKLNCRLLDKATLETQLADYGVTATMMARYDEKKPGLWDRISLEKRRYQHILHTVILETARLWDCVILGRGGQAVMADIPGPLHVRIVAPFEARVARLRGRFECNAEDARRMLKESDQDRAGFHRLFFDVDWANPSLYDVVINSEKLGVASILNGLTSLAQQAPFSERDGEQQQALIDRCLERRIVTLLAYQREFAISGLVVEARDGAVVLKGHCFSEDQIDEAGEAVMQLEDVEEIRNQLIYSPYPSPLHYG